MLYMEYKKKEDLKEIPKNFPSREISSFIWDFFPLFFPRLHQVIEWSLKNNLKISPEAILSSICTFITKKNTMKPPGTGTG